MLTRAAARSWRVTAPLLPPSDMESEAKMCYTVTINHNTKPSHRWSRPRVWHERIDLPCNSSLAHVRAVAASLRVQIARTKPATAPTHSLLSLLPANSATPYFSIRSAVRRGGTVPSPVLMPHPHAPRKASRISAGRRTPTSGAVAQRSSVRVAARSSGEAGRLIRSASVPWPVQGRGRSGGPMAIREAWRERSIPKKPYGSWWSAPSIAARPLKRSYELERRNWRATARLAQ